MHKESKLSLSFILILVFMLNIICPIVLAATEMTISGDFESASAGTALVTSTSATGVFYVGNGSGVVSSDYKKNGNNSAKLTHNGTVGQQAQLNYLLALEAGKTYDISAWVRFDPSFTGTSSFYIRLAGFDNIYYALRGTSAKISGSNDFVEIKTTVTLQSGYDYGKSRININSEAALGETFYVDDVSCKIYEAPTPTPTPTATATATATATPTATATATPNDGNILTNRSFEDTTLPLNLATSSSTGTIVSEYAHTGINSLKIVQTAKYGAVNYTVPISPNKTYSYSAWVKYPETQTKSSTVYMRLFWPPQGASDTPGQIISQVITGSSGWVKIESVLTVPSTASATGLGRFNIASNPIDDGPVTFYIDDVSIVEVPASTEVINLNTNKIADFNNIPLTPINSELDLTFNCSLNAQTVSKSDLLLNGVSNNDLTLTLDADTRKLNVKITNLKYSKIYVLSLTAQKWKDEYGRWVSLTPIKFKTTPKLYIGVAKLYCNGSLITDGVLRTGTIKGEITNITNMCGINSNVSAVLALYKNGEIIDIETTTAVISPNEDGTKIVFSNMVISDVTDCTLKLYIWDDIESGITLAEAHVLD